MMNTLRSSVVVVLCAMTLGTMAQDPSSHGGIDTTEVDLDLLRAPSSPGSVLLGFAENEIERPTTPTAFMLSLRQATEDFSALPDNWAVDIAPSYYCKDAPSARELLGLSAKAMSTGQRIWQSTVISTAVRGFKGFSASDTTLTANPQAGFGFKLSLCDGKPSDNTVEQFQLLDAAMIAYTAAIAATAQANIDQDSISQALEREADSRRERKNAAADRRDALEEELANTIDSARRTVLARDIHGFDLEAHRAQEEGAVYLKLMAERAAELGAAGKDANRERTADRAQTVLDATSNFKVERTGFVWDLAGGMVLDFVDRRADNSYVTKAGLWTTLGDESGTGRSFLFLARLLYNPDKVFMGDADTLELDNIMNLDLGARFAIDPKDGRFTLSAEAIYRQVQDDLGIEPTWRVLANAAYDMGDNRRISFSFGKNFDGTTTTNGNLIAALNLVLGFGGKRDY